MTTLRTAALWYAAHGLAVFPCRPRRKTPLTKNGHLDATTDQAQIEAWWSEHPEANIGLPCEPNGLVVLDVDRHADKSTGEIIDGFATLAELSDGAELVTPTADTGGGGVHYLLRLPEWKPTGKAGPGLDVKANGYILVAPSVHPDGPVYRWREGLSPSSVQVAEVPDWLAAKIRRRQRQTAPGAPAPTPIPVDPDGRLSDREVALAALSRLSPDMAYHEWLAVGMALHSVSADLLGEWDAWSAQSASKYQPGACESKWQGFRGDGGTKIATLVSMAQAVEPAFLKPGWRAKETPRQSQAAAPAQDEPPADRLEPEGEVLPDVGHCRPGAHRCDDIGNAERFAELCGARFRYCWDWQTWLVYDGTRWALDTAGAAMSAARAVARSILHEAWAAEGDDRSTIAKHAILTAKRGQLEAMLYLARSDLAVLSKDLDTNPHLLNALNGTVDLRTGKLRPHDPSDMLTRRVSSAYVPGADLADTPGARDWRQFIADITNGDAELAAYLQRAAGYSVTGDPCEECLFFAHGPERTGKSTFLVTIKHHLADYADQVDFTAFLRKRDDSELKPELAKLQGKRFVASSETNAGRTLAEGLIKTITGNEPISAAAKFKDPVTWLPAFTLWLAANDRPVVRHDDGALWRRLKVVPFVHQVAADAVDLGLKSRLRETAGEAVLAWLVRGCLDWQRSHLGTCAAVEAAIEVYREDMDPLGVWLADCCDVRLEHDEWFTPSSLLFDSYRRWCEAAGEHVSLTQKKFGQHLTARNLNTNTKRCQGKVQRGFKGIRLTAQPELFDDEEEPSRGNPLHPSKPLPELGCSSTDKGGVTDVTPLSERSPQGTATRDRPASTVTSVTTVTATPKAAAEADPFGSEHPLEPVPYVGIGGAPATRSRDQAETWAAEHSPGSE